MVQVTRFKGILGICLLAGIILLFSNNQLSSSWNGSSPVFLTRKWVERASRAVLPINSPCDTELMGPLRSRVEGTVLCPGDEGFGQAIQIFNIKYRSKHIPAIAFQPHSAQGVVDALLLAKDFGMVVTVKNGGHNPAGLTREEGGLLIDMGKMKRVEVDTDSMTMVAEGGALWSDAQDTIKDKNISFVGGGCTSVGVVGLVLGGGVGWTSRKRGLASDNVLNMEVVLENGTITTASETTNQGLFWGLRGAGGSNFGVVTKVSIKVFQAEPEYFAGSINLRTENPEVWRKIIKGWLDGAQDLTDNGASPWMVLTRTLKYGTFPSRKGYRTNFGLPLFYDGESSQGARAFAPILHRMGNIAYEHPEIVCTQKGSTVCKNQPTNQSESELAQNWLQTGQPFFQKHSFLSWSQSMGAKHIFMEWKSGMVDQISPSLVTAVIESLTDVPMIGVFKGQGTLHLQFQVEYLGGKMSEHPPSYSSFSHRSAKLLWSVQAILMSGNKPSKSVVEASEEWSNSAFRRLQPFFKGSYSNYADLGLNDQDWQHQYYRKNYEQLQKLKQDVGGFELFRGRQRIEKPYFYE